jgi:hypothetical protein
MQWGKIYARDICQCYQRGCCDQTLSNMCNTTFILTRETEKTPIEELNFRYGCDVSIIWDHSTAT